MVTESSLPRSQQPASLFYPESQLSSLRHSTTFPLRQFKFSSCTPRSSKLSPSFQFPHQNSVLISLLTIRATLRTRIGPRCPWLPYMLVSVRGVFRIHVCALCPDVWTQGKNTLTPASRTIGCPVRNVWAGVWPLDAELHIAAAEGRAQCGAITLSDRDQFSKCLFYSHFFFRNAL